MNMIKDFQKTAIVVGEKKVSYCEMLQRIHLFSQHTTGDKGDRVLILSENREGWIYAFFSIWEKVAVRNKIVICKNSVSKFCCDQVNI